MNEMHVLLMKTSLLYFSLIAVLFFVRICDSERTNSQNISENWRENRNNFYNFSIKIPDSLGYSLYETEPEIEADSLISYFLMDSYSTAFPFLIELHETEVRLSDSTYLPTAEFGERSYRLNLKYDNLGEYSEGVYTNFKGVRAFEFIAQKAFGERGLMIDSKGPYNAPERFEKANEGWVLEAAIRVIYFGYKGKYFRIMYDPGDPIAKQLLSSFTLF